MSQGGAFEILKSINDHHGGNLGLYCTLAETGEVAVGDPVVLLPAAAGAEG